MSDEAFQCQHYENCGGYCETAREQEHALCESCLGQHDEDLAEQATPMPGNRSTMQYVYVLITPMGYILGVYADRASAEAEQARIGDGCRLSQEPVIGGAV